MITINRILLCTILCLVLLHELEVCRASLPNPLLGVHIRAKHRPHKVRFPGAGRLNKPFTLLGALINCKEKCDFRCSLASRYRMCFRACNTCCQRCNCVPPGTSGNAEVCPCWNNMVTHAGKKKCP